MDAAAARASRVWQAAHATAAAFERPEAGRLRVTGRQRLDLLHRITTNDIRGLSPGGVAPTLLVTAKGRLIERLVVLCRQDDLFLLSSPGGRAAARDGIRRFIVTEDVQVTDLTDTTTEFEILGPEAESIAARLREGGQVAPLALASLPGCGGPAVVVIVEQDAAPTLRTALGDRVEPGDDTLYEALRIEAGRPGFGQELTEDWNPLEMGQADAVSFTKGCYIGQEVIARLRTYDKVKRRLLRLEFPGADPIPSGAKLGGAAGSGILTSAAPVPGEARTVALGILDHAAFDSRGEVVATWDGGARQGAIIGPVPTDTDFVPPTLAPPGMAKGRFRPSGPAR